MLNQTGMLERVGISMVAIRFMVGSRTAATRGFPSARSIEITPDLISRLPGQTSNFAIIPSTTAGEIPPMKNTVLIIASFIIALVANGQVLPSEPKIGDTYTITIPVCRIDVAWNGKENLNFTYAAPAGWQVLDYSVAKYNKRQRAKWAAQLVPSTYSGISEEVVSSKFNELLDLAAQKGVTNKYAGKIQQMRGDYEKAFSKTFVSHSSLIVKGSVRGNNEYLSRKPGRLYLDLKIRVVYLPTSEQEFNRAIQVMRILIQQGDTPLPESKEEKDT
jgi:hypothetical protein